ncbi:MAG TPA: hypothetical protein VIW23_09940 [Candidatus Acidoferrum sp.]|jgi:hypothetical protein
MPRVVPSDVVKFIDQVFPWLRTGPGGNLARAHSGEAAGLLALIDKIPEELLILAGGEYGEFVCSVSAIKDKTTLWQSQQNPNIETYLGQSFRGLNPVTLIRQLLAKCPDEGPTSSTSELSFIADKDLQANLRNDLAAVDRALSNSEWKAATILAGSAIEALLLWDIQERRRATYPTAVSALVANKTFDKTPSVDPEDWSLHNYVEVEAHLGAIKTDTATEVRLAKQFRNLIHPGRAQRRKQNYDKGTAFSSVAALVHVARDLSS